MSWASRVCSCPERSPSRPSLGPPPAPPLPDPLLQPTPAFVLSLPDPRDQASTPLRDTALTFLTHNWGGITGQVSLVRTWLEALSPDVVAEQEL